METLTIHLDKESSIIVRILKELSEKNHNSVVAVFPNSITDTDLVIVSCLFGIAAASTCELLGEILLKNLI